MDARNIYARIVSGKPVTVHNITKSNFASLRTQLHRHHKLMREIGGSELSLLSTYDEKTCTAVYKVDQRKPRMQFLVEVDGEVVAPGHPLTRSTDTDLTNGVDHGPEISAGLESASPEREGNIDLSESSTDNQSYLLGYLQGETQEQRTEEGTGDASIWQSEHRTGTDQG